MADGVGGVGVGVGVTVGVGVGGVGVGVTVGVGVGGGGVIAKTPPENTKHIMHTSTMHPITIFVLLFIIFSFLLH